MTRYIVQCRTCRSTHDAFQRVWDYVVDHDFYNSGSLAHRYTRVYVPNANIDIHFVPDEMMPMATEGFRGEIVNEQDLQSWLEEVMPPISISVTYAELGKEVSKGFTDALNETERKD